MTKIGIIIGSTRPGRNAEQVAKWYYEIAKKRTDAEFELIDIADYDLPLLDEALPAGWNQYANEHTIKWAAKIGEFDGYVMVTPEYNHSTSAALKNAIDYLGVEWANKAVGFVSYGSAMGVRAVEHLRQIVGELQMADVRQQVMFSLFTDFEEMQVFKPAEMKIEDVNAQLDQLIAWSKALKTIR
ncbi:NAD(P)H-dependent oxidoreductase [Tissierella sp. Yu-01]|uniref:NADPH-dependent FMN reductase n=1 Tax=Tissierella sp. Yu-01 TaxID=3035694 RepID=UPI00240DADB7|nr:NAD(P)H-dependent oxidoreductase [Tissierella sp. Yu-01]WFA08927.1 NAD(P)H-dependent oxidoreductase [Tissierella sp. Yu-01]